jgi:uncharacterized protein YodC (DUF2158 family)
MAEGFEVGDVVQLKSGGARMTVAEIEASRDNYGRLLVKCIWLAGGKRQEADFLPELLVLVPKEKPKK